MKFHSLMATVILSSALAAGCASTSSTQNTAAEAEFNQAMAAAEASQDKAASVGGEWRDIGKIMKQAREAAASGDYDKALSLAETARLQGEIGYDQAMSQQAAGPSF